MALEDILESLETEAREQCADIMARAESQATKLITEAKEDAAATIESSKKSAIESLRSQEARVLLDARFKTKKLVVEAKEKAIDKVFAEAESFAAKLPESPAYKDIFKRLVLEAFQGGGANGSASLTLNVNPRDAGLAKAFVTERSATKNAPEDIRIATKEDIKSGVAMVMDNGRKTGINTLESRLHKAKQILRTTVGAILFDDDN